MARILIVDDLEFMRSLLREILKQQGFELVGEARNGKEALLMYSQLQPDVVLLDINMPEMDGITALKKLKAQSPNAKVIMCSAISEQNMIMKAVQLGAKDYIVKPFREERVYSALQRVLKNESA